MDLSDTVTGGRYSAYGMEASPIMSRFVDVDNGYPVGRQTGQRILSGYSEGYV
jgi:hypothetical protein